MTNKFIQYVRGEQNAPGERKLVQKLDFFILTFCCLMYFLNYLDRTNLKNAYVSGMKEELNFRGNQLNQINTVFTVGYTIGQVPCNIALYYIKPRIFFPTCMVIWAGLTMATAGAQSPGGIMAIRFFQAIFEASTFVGTHYILGSWYTENELGKRSGIFTASGLAGTMIGGFIQTGFHSSMDGLSGLPGWRWLFIVDGIITLPVAVYGFLLFPDTPRNTKARYLTADEKALAISRVPEVSERTPISWTFLKHCFSTWYWYFFVVLWIIAGETESFSTNALLSLYMKSHPRKKYNITQLNNYPTGVPAVGIASTLFWATLTDFMGGKRYLVGFWIALTGVITSALILAYPNNTSVHFDAYYWAGSVYACQATFFAWANDVLRYEEDSLRAVVIASMNMGSNAINAWWSIVFYGANFAPRFTRGMWAMICVSIGMAIWTALLAWMQKRTESKREVRNVTTTMYDKKEEVAHVQEKGAHLGA
ncbi:MFS general substrate transporter [Amniculicola lignicola CBS 123094]|uniref:MFS general substrate transporter n=1 Tax=Amniculicola lignicola CBS 123094 TaxID=1392246 RepID=A0A6A5W8H8_9PLEO|nr:MFS general substrate transporter [Amniculicola lignicola CBS 123094]